jgi:triphosphoribosyl-dephospho-CoA synthase
VNPRDAFLCACRLDVEVRKPGNVSVASPGHGMDAAMFIASSEAAAAPLFADGAPVGARIEGAVAASFAAAGCNTNLGIVLLCAPLARALEAPGAASSARALQSRVGEVLSALDIDDARAAFRAIARANPGGLGRAPREDVAAAPGVSLLEAMRLAAGRDRIARQYADGYAELFAIGLPAWAAGRDAADATLRVFLAWLSSAPDSHIARKHGIEVAQAVTAESRAWTDQPGNNPEALARWDAALKARGLNPGTSADLTVATAFVAGCLHGPARGATAAAGLA